MVPVTFRVVCGHPIYYARGVLTGSLTELAQHLGCSLDELGPIMADPAQHDRIVPEQGLREQDKRLNATEAPAKRADFDEFDG
jgi:hypothetical protein